eukprot:PhF_6_TR26058/c0_g1_i1/m.36720
MTFTGRLQWIMSQSKIYTLYTVVTRSLLVGYDHEGDVLPHEIIKIDHIAKLIPHPYWNAGVCITLVDGTRITIMCDTEGIASQLIGELSRLASEQYESKEQTRH